MAESEAASVPSVSVDEMAFAIALFVAAANGRITLPRRRPPVPSGIELGFDMRLLRAKADIQAVDEGPPEELPLASAVSVLWHHYERDERQQEICARLVAFYSLMVRSKGALLKPWMEESTLDPRTVVLETAIVQAVAIAPLNASGQFADVEFRGLVQSLAEGAPSNVRSAAAVEKTSAYTQRPATAIPIPDIIKQLSVRLYAYQACVAHAPNTPGNPKFYVVEALCSRITTMCGSAGLCAMLSRALLATHSQFPWLRMVHVSPLGDIEGLDQIQPPPDPDEAMRCEMALLGLLVELLRSFVGETLTVQLLKTVWPLAGLNLDL